MTLPKVTYFDFSGSRGEDIRLSLALAGVKFEDSRVDAAAFAAMKPDLPFGALPVFQIEGHPVMAQTNAILRLIGRLHGLYPEDPYQAARHDQVMDAVEDLRHKIGPTTRIADAAEKKAARQALAAGYLPQWGRGIDALAGKGRFIGGDKPGVADIKLYMADRWLVSGALDDIPTTVLDSFPQLKAVARNVAALPAISAWNQAKH